MLSHIFGWNAKENCLPLEIVYGSGMRVLLIITGSIAAEKIPDLLHKLKSNGHSITCVLTRAGAEFIIPDSLERLTGNKTYTELFTGDDGKEMGHIRLSREADLVVVAPATADIMAKMAAGLADDLASTLLLATDKPVMIAPAMNVRMWENKAVQRNALILKQDGVLFIGPESGDLACGEEGWGRMSEPKQIADRVEKFFKRKDALKGLKVLVTAGPTIESIDPVRYIANRSSGKQGYAIAESLAAAGAEVTLVTGPTSLPKPHVAKIIEIESASEMLDVALKNLPADIAVMAAAVADWGIKNPAKNKMKNMPELKFTENPDILAEISKNKKKAKLVIGFAAETENLLGNAKKKLLAKKCDWILANNVGSKKVFGSNENKILFIERAHSEQWPEMSKIEVAEKLVEKIINTLGRKNEKYKVISKATA